MAACLCLALGPAHILIMLGYDFSMRFRRLGPYGIRVPRQVAFLRMCRWVTKHTRPRDLFYVFPQGDNRFRLYAERGLVYSWKDGGLYVMANHPRVSEWLRRRLLIEKAVKARDATGICSMVASWGARYWVCGDARGAPPGDLPELVYTREGWRVYRIGSPQVGPAQAPVSGGPD